MKYFLFILSLLLVIACQSDVKKDAKKPYALKIAYNVAFDIENDNYEVFSMNMDGSDKKNITNLKGVEWTYDAYDDDLYFISDKDTLHRHYFLYRMKADGSAKIKVSDFRLADSWHGFRNNGNELVVRPHKSVDTAIYIIDKEGKLLKRIRPDLDMFTSPNFSPDGKKIVFRGGNKSSRFERGYDDELYIMNDDGSGMQQLTHFPRNDSLKKWHSYSAGPPRWHPTENFISYQSERNGRYNLYAVTPDGKKSWKLTDNAFSEGWHDWSPDGKHLAIESFDKEQSQFNIVLMNWETKELRTLTDSSYKYQQAPVFVKFYE
ncbi:MAG: hypothetical protein EX254_08340 [Flavobacteriaceae bacterium]|nr:MAG: hypothetical protein EX254_08340 [Flavobacteriaceae bacterium]